MGVLTAEQARKISLLEASTRGCRRPAQLQGLRPAPQALLEEAEAAGAPAVPEPGQDLLFSWSPLSAGRPPLLPWGRCPAQLTMARWTGLSSRYATTLPVQGRPEALAGRQSARLTLQPSRSGSPA